MCACPCVCAVNAVFEMYMLCGVPYLQIQQPTLMGKQSRLCLQGMVFEEVRPLPDSPSVKSPKVGVLTNSLLSCSNRHFLNVTNHICIALCLYVSLCISCPWLPVISASVSVMCLSVSLYKGRRRSSATCLFVCLSVCPSVCLFVCL